MSDEYYGRVPALNSVSDRFEEGLKMGRTEAKAEIAALQSEREELREALREGLRCVHDLLVEKSNDDLMTRPFLICCQLWFREKSFLVSTPTSGEPKCPRCGSHLRHIAFPIGANLPYRSCDDAWHAAGGEPVRKP